MVDLPAPRLAFRDRDVGQCAGLAGALVHGGRACCGRLRGHGFGDTFGVTPTWEAEGGSITPDGVFTAGAFTGLYLVTARSSGIESEAVVEIVGGAPPATFALHQNFPNPFAAGTTIAFDLPEPARVRIRLFDLRGRQVATLVDADYGAGLHQQALGTLPLTGGCTSTALTWARTPPRGRCWS